MERYTALYCRRCHGYLESVEWRGDVLVWIPMCDWCAARQREREAEEEQRLEHWQERMCVAPDCGLVFTPRQSEQRFCSDRCRKRTHRRLKAQAVSANGATRL